MEQFNYKWQKYNIIVPNEEFILFLGTSHTFGECHQNFASPSRMPHGHHTQRLSYHERYSSIIENELGIKVLALGYPGIDNLGLLQVFNELIQLEVFTHNCKMVILEPRFGASGMVRFDIDFERESIKRDSKNVDPNWREDHYNKSKAQWPWKSIDTMLITTMGPNNLEETRKRIIPEIPKDVVHHRVAFESASIQSSFCDAIVIQTIKNLVINLNDKKIKFVWMLLDPPMHKPIGESRDHLEYVKKIYGDWLDIFDSLVGGVVLRTILERNTPGMLSNLKTRHLYFCSCSHFNSLGNKLIAEAILPDIKKILSLD